MLTADMKYVFEFEPFANILLNKCEESFTIDFIKENNSRIFAKYIDKYFPTWDAFSCSMSSDKCVFSPVILCLKAESLGINPNYPVRVLRALFLKLNMKSDE